MTDITPTPAPAQSTNDRDVPVNPNRLKLEIPRRAIDYAQLTEENIEARVSKIDPRQLHVMAGEVFEDQVIESMKTNTSPDEILLESDALLVEGIQQAATRVERRENSIVTFDAMGGEASAAVTAAVESLAGDKLTEPIAQAAIQILEDDQMASAAEESKAA